MHAAMFLSSQISYAVDNNLTYAPIKNASAAMYTAHAMASLPDVTDHSSVRAVRSCAQRLLLNLGNLTGKIPYASACASLQFQVFCRHLSHLFLRYKWPPSSWSVLLGSFGTIVLYYT
eukprot:1151971-Pelagomonas_calceolata.AAC.3